MYAIAFSASNSSLNRKTNQRMLASVNTGLATAKVRTECKTSVSLGGSSDSIFHLIQLIGEIALQNNAGACRTFGLIALR
jgi:hypothetical protein